MPRTAGKMGFSGCRSENFDGKAQNQGLGKMAKYICVGAPLLTFVFFGGAPGFRQKRAFDNRRIFAETTENVVPNCCGSKTHFGALGSGTSHVRSGSNMVPKYFSLSWHFLSHSPSRRQGKLFHFFAFSLLEHRSLFIVFVVAFCSAITTSMFLFCSVSFLLFLLVVSVFLLVSLLLILLRHSFLSLSLLTSVFLFFFLFYFFVFAFHVFPVVCLIFLFFLFLCFFLWLTPILFLCICLSFVFFCVSRLNVLVLCVCVCVSSFFLVFLIFCVFFSPGSRVRLKRTTMERTTTSLCLPFGDLCENVLCAKLLFILVCGFVLFTEHVFVRYTWNMF